LNPMRCTVLYSDRFLDILHDEENALLHLDWKGYQTDGSIKEGCERASELMVQYKAFKILNDNTNVLGIWTGVSRWLIFDALPRARKAGMTSFAHVYGSSRLSRISAEAALFLLNQIAADIKTFDDIDAARAWLNSRSNSICRKNMKHH
jgi:hypothetical protein